MAIRASHTASTILALAGVGIGLSGVLLWAIYRHGQDRGGDIIREIDFQLRLGFFLWRRVL